MNLNLNLTNLFDSMGIDLSKITNGANKTDSSESADTNSLLGNININKLNGDDYNFNSTSDNFDYESLRNQVVKIVKEINALQN